jgi:hypothetical protein
MFFSLLGGFFSGLRLFWVDFLVWVVLGVVGEDTLKDTGVFLGVFLVAGSLNFFESELLFGCF